MPVDNFVKSEEAEQHLAASSTGQASLMNGTWLANDEQQAAVTLQQQQALLQAYPSAGDGSGLMPQHQHESAGTAAAAAAQHPADLLGHPADMLGAAPGLPHMQAVHPGVPLMDLHPDVLVEAAGGDPMGHLHCEHMHQDVLMPQACLQTHTGNASNGQLLQAQQQHQEQAVWPVQTAQSHSASSSVGADSNARETQQQVQSGLRSSGANTGSNAGNRKG